nr:hypothetical protein BaRGS_022107 [Batillaria attramentaria]
MLSTQQVNRRHEEKLQALEEQLNAQRMRVKMKLWEDTQRLQHDLIQLSIRTPSTCGEFTGAKKEHKASEHLLQQVIGKKEHKGLETPTVENRGKVRFVASQVQQPSLPTVEVRGCNVHLHYQQSQGRPSHTKTFHPDSKTRTLLIRSSRVTDSLSRLSQRKASRFSHQEDVPEFSHDVHETQTTAEEHDAASEWSVQQKDVVASRQSSGNPSGVLALNAVASARKAFTSFNAPRRPSKVLDHSGSSVSGWQLMRFYSLWTTSRKTPTWATSSYLRRKVLEDRKHRRRSARPRQRIQAAMLQAVSVLESGKKAQMENDNGAAD